MFLLKEIKNMLSNNYIKQSKDFQTASNDLDKLEKQIELIKKKNELEDAEARLEQERQNFYDKYGRDPNDFDRRNPNARDYFGAKTKVESIETTIFL